MNTNPIKIASPPHSAGSGSTSSEHRRAYYANRVIDAAQILSKLPYRKGAITLVNDLYFAAGLLGTSDPETHDAPFEQSEGDRPNPSSGGSQ